MLDKMDKTIIGNSELTALTDGISDAVWMLKEILHQCKGSFSNNMQGLIEQKISKLQGVLTP